MATMLAYADRLLVEYWEQYGEGPLPGGVRLELMAMLQNGQISNVEGQIDAMRRGEMTFDQFRERLRGDANIPKVIPWISWSEQILFGD